MPMIPLARELQAAGHDVAFASAPGFDLPEEHGFSVHPVGPDWGRDAEMVRLLDEAQSYSGPQHAKFMLREVFATSSGLRCLPDLVALIDNWRPDVMIAESTELAAAAAAERMEIPYAITTFGVDFPVALMRALAGDVRDNLREVAGVSADPDFDATHRYLRLNFAPPSYQPLATPVSHAIAPVPFDDANRVGLPNWIDALPDRPTVYATLGTVFSHHTDLLQAVAEGLRDEEINLVITVGPDGDPSRFAGLADNLHAERFIPNSLLLPHCAAVVSHAGYGTLMGCLKFGVPMILFPLGADHFMHANRCRDLGVATIIEREQCTPERIRENVLATLNDPEKRSSVQAIQDEIAALPTLPYAVDLIEQLAETRSPIYRHER